jgi:hypothetical protein
MRFPLNQNVMHSDAGGAMRRMRDGTNVNQEGASRWSGRIHGCAGMAQDVR